MKLADTNSEFIRSSPYGVPTSFPRGDYDLDGDVDAADTTALGNFIAGGSYGWNLDFNGDGVADSNDTDEHAAYVTGYDKGLGGRTVLSRSGVRNRAGYAGYEFEPALPNSAWHVRHRVLVSELGRWNRRDPLGYVDGNSLVQYANDNPQENTDASGLRSVANCTRVSPVNCVERGCAVIRRGPGNYPASCGYLFPAVPANVACQQMSGGYPVSHPCPRGYTCSFSRTTLHSKLSPWGGAFYVTTPNCSWVYACASVFYSFRVDSGTCRSSLLNPDGWTPYTEPDTSPVPVELTSN